MFVGATVADSDSQTAAEASSGSVIIRSTKGEQVHESPWDASSSNPSPSQAPASLPSVLCSSTSSSSMKSLPYREEAARSRHERARATARAAWRWLDTMAGERYLNEEVARLRAASMASWRRWYQWEERLQDRIERTSASGNGSTNFAWNASARTGEERQSDEGGRGSLSSPPFAESPSLFWDAMHMRTRLSAGARPQSAEELRESVREIFVANAVAEVLREA